MNSICKLFIGSHKEVCHIKAYWLETANYAVQIMLRIFLNELNLEALCGAYVIHRQYIGLQKINQIISLC